MAKQYEIIDVLKEIGDEITIASQSFYAWKSIHNLSSKDASIFKGINYNALSWNIFLHSLQTTFFISIGRIFDTNQKSCSIHTLFRYCTSSVKEFDKESLKKRKMEGLSEEPDYLRTFLEKAYVPKQSDFIELKKEITRVQTIYETHFRPIRHKIFAHRDSASITDTSLLFQETTINDAEDILHTLYKAKMVIWDLYTNGHPMNFSYWVIKEEKYVYKDIESLLKRII